jgi:hypothetical protein
VGRYVGLSKGPNKKEETEMTAPKTGKCYCGCGKDTSRHFREGEGHDGQALSMLNFLKYGTTNVAEILQAEGFGPNNRNLRQEAEAAGWKSREGR